MQRRASWEGVSNFVGVESFAWVDEYILLLLREVVGSLLRLGRPIQLCFLGSMRIITVNTIN